jgi:hypothetical protein
VSLTPHSPERLGTLQLGQIFVRSGRLRAEELERALAYKNEHNVKLGQALVSLGLISENELIDALRFQGRVCGIVLSPNIVDTVVAQGLPEKEWRRLNAIAVNRIAKTVTVAMRDPSDIVAIDELARRLESRVFPDLRRAGQHRGRDHKRLRALPPARARGRLGGRLGRGSPERGGTRRGGRPEQRANRLRRG